MGCVWSSIKINKDSTLKIAVVLNAITLFIYLLLFYPQMHVDDMIQWYSFSGILSGKLEGHFLWMSDTIAYFLGELTSIFPSIQWLAILEIGMSFVALTITTYIILEHKWGKIGNIIIFLLLTLYGYESYVTIVFTKSAGISVALSLYGLLSTKIGWKPKIICIIDFVLALSMRGAFFDMILGYSF